jgi:rhamnosyltransferase
VINISIIIPVKNGGSTLEKCLKAIKAQVLFVEAEIIVLDSESTDDSKSICLKYGAQVLTIPKETFNHGLTRNIGVEKATGELIYFTVQDAWICETDMLKKMASLFSDAAVQSVTGMQAIPHEVDKNPALWFKRFSKPEVYIAQFNPELFKGLSGSEQMQYCRWDNVNSMYRKSALIAQPFIETNLSEDIVWAKQALEKGWKILKDPSLVVYHYHHQTFRYNFRVNYSVFYADRVFFGILPSYPTVFMPFLRRVKAICNRKEISIWSKPIWICHNAGIFLAHTSAVFIFRCCLFFGGQKLLNKSFSLFCSAIPQGKHLANK